MILTAALIRGRIPGRQWIRREAPSAADPMSFQAKQNMLLRCLEVEAENQYWLSMPSLHDNGAGVRPRRRMAFEAIKAEATSKFPKHRYVADQLDHLNITKKWS